MSTSKTLVPIIGGGFKRILTSDGKQYTIIPSEEMEGERIKHNGKEMNGPVLLMSTVAATG